MSDRTAGFQPAMVLAGWKPAVQIPSGFAKPPRDTRVVAAMSGGVDSSVVAAMLAREGYDVVGVTLQLYDHGAAVNKPGACCAGQDIHDARRVADTHRLSRTTCSITKAASATP